MALRGSLGVSVPVAAMLIDDESGQAGDNGSGCRCEGAASP